MGAARLGTIGYDLLQPTNAPFLVAHGFTVPVAAFRGIELLTIEKQNWRGGRGTKCLRDRAIIRDMRIHRTP